MQGRAIASLVLIAAILATSEGCKKKHHHQKSGPPSSASSTPGFALTSTAFAASAAIPAKYSMGGGNTTPPLAWTGAPAATKELALVVTDPDPPANGFVHWVVYAIPATATGLKEGLGDAEKPADPAGSIQGKNQVGKTGWYGPDPPSGDTHHYHFHLYALDAPLGAAPGLTAENLIEAMKGHIVGETELVGTFEK